jgi:hypothetical protein
MAQGANTFDTNNQIEFELTQTDCGCSSGESTGQAGTFTLSQHHGRIYFSWIDQVRVVFMALRHCLMM